MSKVKIFRSTDSNAPKMGGWAGAATDVLLACLVNGYGSVFATATITSSGVNVSNNDTVTIDGVVYTFKTALTPAANEVLIGASAAASIANLAAAINQQGTSGTTYGAGTLTPPSAYASNVTATVITITARKGGTSGNSVAIAKSAATLTLSGATLSGGSGSDTTAGAGWTNPFNGNGGQRVFRGGSGVQHYYHVDDASPNTTAVAKEAQFRGSEGATAFQNATNYFPTTAQLALGSGLGLRKSAAASNTQRAWIVIADDRTCYLLIQTADTAGLWMGHMFGEFYSLSAVNDPYRSLVVGRNPVNDATSGYLASFNLGIGTVALVGHYVPRSYTGGGTSLPVGKIDDQALANNASTSHTAGQGVLSGVDPCIQSLIIAACRITEPGVCIRGRLRGLVAALHAATTFGDGDFLTPAAGTWAGRTFLIVKNIDGASSNLGLSGSGPMAFDISGDWETNT